MECIECIPLNSKWNVSLKVWENLDSPKKWHDLGEVQYINLQLNRKKLFDIMHQFIRIGRVLYDIWQKHFILLVLWGHGVCGFSV